MVRIFTVERGLFMGGWGDRRGSVAAVGVCEHSDMSLQKIVADAPSFFGGENRKVCRVESTITGGSMMTQQRRTLELVSGGSPPELPGGVRLQAVGKPEPEPRVSLGTLSFNNGSVPYLKLPGSAPHNYIIEEPNGSGSTTRYVARRTKSLLFQEQWALEGSTYADPSTSATWTWVDGDKANPDESGRERDKPTDSWVLFAIKDPQGAIAAKVWMLPAIKDNVGMTSPTRLGKGYYAIEMGPGDSYGARMEANCLPRALLFSLAMLHSYEYDKSTWLAGN
ncbi:hypothetical protein TrCOL_g232 [Triparma columacea]|uniref:Uncharacterized protein n=1 Tax=Triparma columacea TaxID=722753 RepID=A0A9W7G496_9STRA|nr:hypothetical protein TrCOL_g232 [Triparma columacea]